MKVKVGRLYVESRQKDEKEGKSGRSFEAKNETYTVESKWFGCLFHSGFYKKVNAT